MSNRQREEEFIPVYLVTGFLESGKTTLIHSMLEDQDFSRGQKTLVLCCEEGIEEYDGDILNEGKAVVATFDKPEELTTQRLIELQREHKPERVIMEYNSVWGIELLAKTAMPRLWQMVQVITMADATTFDNYMTNLRQLLTDPMKEADLILVNRCKPEHNISSWRRQMKAFNPRCTIIFENVDGTTDDGVSDEDLPYDMKASVISIPEACIGTFYLDAMDHPDRYDGKTVRLTGQYFQEKSLPKGYAFFGRLAMTCCANDIAEIGWVCQHKKLYGTGVYVSLTAKCQKMQSGDQTIIMFHEVDSEKAPKPKEEYVTFS